MVFFYYKLDQVEILIELFDCYFHIALAVLIVYKSSINANKIQYNYFRLIDFNKINEHDKVGN